MPDPTEPAARMKSSGLVVAVAALITLTACTVEKTGSPTPGTTGRPSTSAASTRPTTATPSSTTRLLPPRPRDLDLTGVNPCTDVLTREQLHQLAYDLGYLRKPIPDKSPIHGGPTCLYSSSDPPDQPGRHMTSLIVISMSEGAEAWLTDPRRKRPPDRYRTATVAGFPALAFPNPVVVDNCAVVVDVHDGQYLQVGSRPGGGTVGTSPDPYCAEAQRVAEFVIQTLSTRR